mgnify:CR=1 FL=1
MTISNPSFTSNIHSGSKKGEEAFWSNISQEASTVASLSPMAPSERSNSAISCRMRLTASLYFRFVLTVLAPKILCLAIFNSSFLARIVGVSNSEESFLSSPINVLAATNFASRFGSGRIPKFSAGLSLAF